MLAHAKIVNTMRGLWDMHTETKKYHCPHQTNAKFCPV